MGYSFIRGIQAYRSEESFEGESSIHQYGMIWLQRVCYQQEYIQMKQQEQLPYTPQYGDHGNVIKKVDCKTKEGEGATAVIECSDILFSEFEGYGEKLKALRVSEVQIMRKDLDKPLSLFKSFLAKIASIKEEHQFLLLRTERFQVTVDYYIKNRLVVRLGDPAFVFDSNKSEARKRATIVREENGLEWRRVLKQDEELTLGAILEMLLHFQLREFNQISYTGSHFSREAFLIIQNTLIK